jgi:hypothetical protein
MGLQNGFWLVAAIAGLTLAVLIVVLITLEVTDLIRKRRKR